MIQPCHITESVRRFSLSSSFWHFIQKSCSKQVLLYVATLYEQTLLSIPGLKTAGVMGYAPCFSKCLSRCCLFGFPFFLFSWHPTLFHRRSKMFWQDSLEAFWHFTANFVTEEIPKNSLRSVNSTYCVADNVKWMSDLFKWNINRNTDFP